MTHEPGVDVKDLIAAVRAHALKHYEEDGWDYVEECFDDAQILEVITDALTPADAIEAVRKVVHILDDRRRDVQGEIF